MRPIALVLAVLAASAVALGFELKPPTLAAYDRYVALTEARLATERDGTSPFLWIDRQPAAERARLMTRLRAGEVVVDKLETRDRGAAVSIDGGLVTTGSAPCSSQVRRSIAWSTSCRTTTATPRCSAR